MSSATVCSPTDTGFASPSVTDTSSMVYGANDAGVASPSVFGSKITLSTVIVASL